MSKSSLMNKLGLTEADFQPKLKDEATNDKMQMLMDLLSVDRVPSDKVGYVWEVIKLGDAEIRKTYVKDTSAKGTMDNPYTDDSILTDNAYYIIDGVKYVCMSGQLVEFEW